MSSTVMMCSKWSYRSISDISTVVSGGTPSRNKQAYWANGTIPWVKTGQLSKQKITIDDIDEFITEEALSNSSAKIVPAGTILIAMYGQGKTRGTSAVLQDEAAINQACAALLLNTQVDGNYVFQQLLYNYDNLRKISNSGSQDNLSIDLIKSYKIPFPPGEDSVFEQRRIAEFLGTWDEAIEKLERLIEAKEKRLSWIRANILTGKVRLKNHYANWKLQHLASILDEHKEKSSGQELVHSVSVHKGVVNQIEHLGRNFAAKDTSNYNLAKPGDIIYTKSPTGDFPYGIIKLNQNDYNVIVSPLYGVFTPKWPELGIWLDCYFEASQNAINYLHPIIQKGAKNTINITNKTFLSNVLLLPTEQNEVQEICQIISNIKAELVLLTQELDAFQKQKRGLMQKLLTGTWRV